MIEAIMKVSRQLWCSDATFRPSRASSRVQKKDVGVFVCGGGGRGGVWWMWWLCEAIVGGVEVGGCFWWRKGEDVLLCAIFFGSF